MGEKNMQAAPLLTINDMAFHYSKRFIWGINQESVKLFFRCCNMRVYIDGFVDDELAGRTIYHKMIYRIEDIPAENSILFVSQPGKKGEITSEIAVCDHPVIMNPKTGNADIYIYGAGKIGKWLLDYLKQNHITVKGFIDTDLKKVNTDLSGIRVYGQSVLKSLDQGTIIIEAGKYYQEIDLIVRECNQSVERYYCENTLWFRDDMIWIDENIFFGGAKSVDGSFDGKTIYLCGNNDDVAGRYCEVFQLLDFKDTCIAKWEDDIDDAGDFCCIEDAVLEENCFIIFCSEVIGKRELGKLYDLGLERGKDFCDIRCNIWEKAGYLHSPQCQGIQILDINLAYTRDMQGEVPGIAVLGDNRKDNYKIAILGASTTTSGYFWIKSWPEILYDKYLNGHVTIFNGAVEGYTSAQELIKLMRDIVGLKPDMVIVYDGYNDVARKAAFPDMPNVYAIPYMKTIMEYAGGGKAEKYNIFCGMPSTGTVIEDWLKNIEYMHAVCEINHIKFLSCVQPLLYSKPDISLKGDRILKEKWDLQFGTPEVVTIPIRELRKAAAEICQTHKYIYDLSHIFDDQEVYMDFCHVFEAGNEIIADEIYKILKKMEKDFIAL